MRAGRWLEYPQRNHADMCANGPNHAVRLFGGPPLPPPPSSHCAHHSSICILLGGQLFCD